MYKILHHECEFLRKLKLCQLKVSLLVKGLDIVLSAIFDKPLMTMKMTKMYMQQKLLSSWAVDV